MSALQNFVFEGKLGEHRIRFVRSPIQYLDVPWVFVADMLLAVGAGPAELEGLLRSARQATSIRSRIIGDEIVQIAPPWTLFYLADAIGIRGASMLIMAAFSAACPELTPEERGLALIGAPSAIPGDEAEGENR